MIKAVCFFLAVPVLNAQLSETTEPSYWRFAHRDAQLVASVNWKAIEQATPANSFWRAMGETLGKVEKFLVTSPSTGERLREPGQTLIIASGRFDLALMKKAAAKEGEVAIPFKGATLFGPPKIDDNTVLLAYVDSTVALAGVKAVIGDALDRGEQIRNGPLSEKNELFGTAMDMSRLNDLFVITNVSGKNRADEKSPFFGLNAYAAGYKLADGVQLSMHINAATEELARGASLQLPAILSQMNTNFPGLIPAKAGLSAPVFLNNMKMALEESDLHAWSQVTSAQLATLKKNETTVLAAAAAPKRAKAAEQRYEKPGPAAPPEFAAPRTPQVPALAVGASLDTAIQVPPPPKKVKVVRIEGLDGGLREIPYGPTGRD